MKLPFTLVATVLAAGSVSAQTLELQPAVQLNFDALATKSYLIEGSSDLATWTPAAPAVAGQAGEFNEYFPGTAPHQFYRVSANDVADLSAQLASIRATHNLPALGCAVVMSNRVVGLGVVGVRKHNVSEPATVGDRWHHGSLTKSMTALLAARLVDDGVITWTTKLVDLFPEHAGTRHAGWNTVTLEMLVTNSGGAPEVIPAGTWDQIWNHPGTPREARLFITQEITKVAPRFTPGTAYEYSNAGFAMAGAMLEKVTNKAWEDLMTEQLFRPLGMTTAQFGVPATPRHVDHPWGHTFSGNVPVPVAPGPSADNPPGIGPAATANCSLVDFARYLAVQLAGARGEGTFLQPATVAKVFTPAYSNYAMGWTRVNAAWGGGVPVFTHSGSNTQWFTNVWLAPGRNWAVVVVTNIGGNTAFTATDAVVGAMVTRFIP